MSVLEDVSPHAAVDCSDVRSREAEILLQAITELHGADILTGVEFEAKRKHLASCH